MVGVICHTTRPIFHHAVITNKLQLKVLLITLFYTVFWTAA